MYAMTAALNVRLMLAAVVAGFILSVAVVFA